MLKITEREFKTKRTLFTAQMMSHGEVIIQTPYRCQCIKMNKIYIVFTNRKIKINHGKKILRIKGKDKLIGYKKFVQLATKSIRRCNIGKKLPGDVTSWLSKENH